MSVLSLIVKAIADLAVRGANCLLKYGYGFYIKIFRKYIYKYSNSTAGSTLRMADGLEARGLKDAANRLRAKAKSIPGLSKLKWIDRGGTISKFFEGLFSMAVELETVDYILVDWFNNYLDNASEPKVNGALNSDTAFENLRGLLLELVVLENMSESGSEIAEFFTEGISNAMGEIFEKQLIGSLSIQTNLRYGSVELDPDSISEAAESRMIDPLWHTYEVLLSGGYNSTCGYTIAKGRFRTLQEMTQVLHQDIFYNIMKAYEGYQATSDIYLDESRELYKKRLYSGRDDVEKGLDKWLTQLLSTISYVDSLIDDIGEMSDKRWAEIVKDSTKSNYNRTMAKNISKLNFIYDFMIEPPANQWDENIAVAQQYFNTCLSKHDSMRQEMCNILVGKEQYLYTLTKASVDDTVNNVYAMRNTGQFNNSNDVFKNNLNEVV